MTKSSDLSMSSKDLGRDIEVCCYVPTLFSRSWIIVMKTKRHKTAQNKKKLLGR